MTIFSSALAPEIIQYFNIKLLSRPAVKFCDDAERLWWIYEWIEKKLSKKAMKHEGTRLKYERLKKQFLELYERAKTKEDELEKSGKKQDFFAYIYIGDADRRHRELFKRIKWKRVYETALFR